jgi:hypothetical protein
MTSDTARATADVVLVSVGIAAATAVLRTPRLRRIAVRMTRAWLGASVPVYLLSEIRRAWAESAQVR